MQVAHDLSDAVKTVLSRGVFNVTKKKDKEALQTIVRELMAALIEYTAVTGSEIEADQEELFSLLNAFETQAQDEAAEPPERKRDEVVALMKKVGNPLGFKVRPKDPIYSDEADQAADKNMPTRSDGKKSCACKAHGTEVYKGDVLLRNEMVETCPQKGVGEGAHLEVQHAHLFPQKFQGQTGKYDDRCVMWIRLENCLFLTHSSRASLATTGCAGIAMKLRVAGCARRSADAKAQTRRTAVSAR
jgi:hypothetical protein